LPPGLEDSLPATLEDLFDRTRVGVRRSAELYINVCNIMDRLVKRREGVAADHARIALSLQSLPETSAATYATDTNDVPLLNDGLVSMGKHLRTCQSIMEDESKAWDEGVLEDLKRQRDALVSIRELFERRERLDKDNIPYLERRIQTNETKLANLRNKPEGMVKPGEIEKVVEAIIKVCFGVDSRCIIHLTMTLGQGVHREPAQPVHFRQGMHPRRASLFPGQPVPRLPLEPRLGPGKGQILGAPCRQLAPPA